VLSKQANDNSNDNENDDEEKYEDMPLSDDENVSSEQNGPEKDKSASASWFHNKNIDTNRTKSQYYDPNGRNPLYANAESVDLWELDLMRKHFHPSTNLFAQKILDNTSIEYDGDPLSDFTLKHFLDRFVFRNPKKLNKRSAAAKGSRVFGRIPSSDKRLPAVNSDEYVNQPENKVPVDEKFIYAYLKQRSKADDNSDVESVTSVEFERMLDQYEPGNKKEKNIDFANHFYEVNKTKAKKNQESGDQSDEELDDQISDDDEDELDFADDEEFADAFEGVDSELDEALDRSTDQKVPKKKGKKEFDKVTNDLFASADEFAQLLEANESDSDISDGDQSDNEGQGPKGSKKRVIKPKLGRNYKKKLDKNIDL